MKSDRPKVLHEICGRPMLGFVLSACRLAGVDRLVVVVGHGREAVQARFSADGDIAWVEQSAQLGTGHAVLCCREALEGVTGSVLVVAGDMPLIRREALVDLLEARARSGDAMTMATTTLNDPAGYGRIVRDADGSLVGIVEDRHCTDEQRSIREVNPSYYCFGAEHLFGALDRVGENSSSGEQYLTDVVQVLQASGERVSATVAVPAEDASGVNSRLDLARVGRLMQDRTQLRLMNDGVTIVDPDNTWINADVSVGRDTTIFPFTVIGVGATIGSSCRIGPFARIGCGDTVSDGMEVGPGSYNGAKT